MISVIAKIEVAAGRRDEFLAAFRQLVPKVLAEDGCLEYGPWIDAATDVPMQEPAGGDVVVAIEKWASVEALKAHLEAPHMVEFRGTIEGLVTGISLQILQPPQ